MPKFYPMFEVTVGKPAVGRVYDDDAKRPDGKQFRNGTIVTTSVVVDCDMQFFTTSFGTVYEILAEQP